MSDNTESAQGPIQHHPLCGKEIIPAEQPLWLRLTALQVAYSQGIEDAVCAIRAESQGGGYWAAAYINAIARRCSPFWYAGLPLDADEATREQVVRAITDIQEARDSHAQWAAHLRAPHTVDCQGCIDHAAHIGDAEYHDEWVAKYDNVIAVLGRTPFATTPSPDAAREAPTCWHCGVVLAYAPKLRCEDCPDECDVEGCDEMGCSAVTNATQRRSCSKCGADLGFSEADPCDRCT